MDIVFNGEQQARATVISPAGDQTSVSASLISSTGRQMTICCDIAAPIGTAVKVEWTSYLVLAEITDIQQAGHVVLRIRHAFEMRHIEEIRRNWV